jgi:hypothetical protein
MNLRALAQIFAITPDAMGKAFNTEMFVTYYDIFTRNAFRTYKDVLKEVGKLELIMFDASFLQMIAHIRKPSQITQHILH